MSDVYRTDRSGTRDATPHPAASCESGPILSETLLEIATTLAAISAVFGGIMTLARLGG